MTNSESNKILVVGDCIANGQNLLLPEILSKDEVEGDNLKISQEPGFNKKLLAWYLKKSKSKTHDAYKLLADALKFKRQQEKELSWVKHLPDSVNLTGNGETFQVMHKKLRDYLNDHGKPKFVLITDFSPSHRCVVINADGEQHVVKRDDTFLDQEQEIVPKNIYELFLSSVEKQKKYGEEYQKRKNLKSFDMLIRLLGHHDIQWRFLIFRPENSYLLHRGHDMTKFLLAVQSSNGYDLCTKKLSVQEEIAHHIITHVLP